MEFGALSMFSWIPKKSLHKGLRKQSLNVHSVLLSFAESFPRMQCQQVNEKGRGTHVQSMPMHEGCSSVYTKIKLERIFRCHEDESVVINDPLTWKKECAFGDCKDCKTLKLYIPENIKKVEVTYSSWQVGEKVQEVKTKKGKKQTQDNTQSVDGGKEVTAKKVYGLFNITTVEDVATTFLKSLPRLKRHIFIAHNQWDAHSKVRENLTVDSLITIEDYQRNIEVEYIEQPTSMAYSSNKLTVAVYPICLEFKMEDDGPVHKGAITFISDDKLHDHQQVKAFEKRMFEMVRNKYGFIVNHWQRWSDGCGAQFKSKFVNHDLLQARDEFQLKNTGFCYFEAHEGKNTSDTIGSIVKCAFLKGIAKENEGIGNAADVVALVKKNVRTETKKFDFFEVEEFPFMERLDEDKRPEFLISGISKVHQMFVKDGGLIAEELACTTCSPVKLCEECERKDFYQLSDSEDEDDRSIQDESDVGCSDLEDSDADDVENYNFGPGDIVWAKYGRTYFPAKVVNYKELSEKLQADLNRTRKSESIVVEWYGENNYSWVNVRNLDELSENKCDSARVAVNEDIYLRYQQALADLRND